MTTSRGKAMPHETQTHARVHYHAGRIAFHANTGPTLYFEPEHARRIARILLLTARQAEQFHNSEPRNYDLYPATTEIPRDPSP